MTRLIASRFVLSLALVSIPLGTASAYGGKAAKAIAKEAGLDIYHATRKDQDFYELQEGFVIKTKYCYAYAYSEEVVIVNMKMIFLSSDDICQVDGIYQK